MALFVSLFLLRRSTLETKSLIFLLGTLLCNKVGADFDWYSVVLEVDLRLLLCGVPICRLSLSRSFELNDLVLLFAPLFVGEITVFPLVDLHAFSDELLDVFEVCCLIRFSGILVFATEFDVVVTEIFRFPLL